MKLDPKLERKEQHEKVINLFGQTVLIGSIVQVLIEEDMFTGSFVELRKDLMSLNMPKFASTSEYNQKLTRFPNDYIKCHLKLAMEYEEYDYTPFLPPPISVSPIAPHVPIGTRVLFVARFSKSVPVDCDKWALRGQFFNAASLAFNLGPREFPGVLTTDGHSGKIY